jgi:hexosaminidase
MKNYFFVLLYISISSIVNAQNCPILPHPQVFQVQSGFLELPQTLEMSTTGIPNEVIRQILAFSKWYPSPTLKRNDTAEQLLSIKELKNGINDSYSITINDKIEITYTTKAGLFYAFHSLFQLMEKTEAGFKLPKCFISDYPKYEWRGLHLDVARHFFTVDEIKQFLNLMSQYKFNRFHWHLTDDQGWRIEIKKYPLLTKVGAWRDSTVENHYSTHPRTYKKHRYGGFYTQEQITEIVKYAADRHITVVPEIEMPGHSRALLAAYPELSCKGQKQGVPGLWGVFDDILCSKDESIIFMQNILNEVISLFPGEYIHIGGDEAPKVRWEKCPKCQSVIKENNLKDEHDLQSYFISKMDEFLTTKGKKMIGWDEILEGGLSPNAIVMSWRGFEGGIEAAKQGHQVIMSPGSHCYFDHYQGKSKQEPLAIGGYTPLEKVYSFNPIPKEMSPQMTSFVLGAQANLWTEYITNFDHLLYMTYPRAIALSQVLWCDKKPDYESFKKVLQEKHWQLLTDKKVNFSKSYLRPTKKIKRTKKGIALTFEFENAKEMVICKDQATNTETSLGKNDELEIKSSTKEETKSFQLFSACCTEDWTVNNHLALGAKIIYKTQPAPQFNPDDVLLVDGEYGTRPWRGHEWVGFNVSNVEFSIELPKKSKFHKVELSFLKESGSWIYLPQNIEITTDSKSKPIILDLRNNENEKVTIPGNFKGKQIHFKISNFDKIPEGLPGSGNSPWTFLDEIRILR